jgi:flagellar biosynthesis protein FlhG
MHDQADQLRKLVREAVEHHADLAPGAPIIAVAGARPGVGATTFTCGLARELASLGKQVVLVDANLAVPALAERLGVDARGTLTDVLAGARRAIEVLADPASNIRLLAGAPAPNAPQLDAQAFSNLHREIAAISRRCDIVLLDAGRGMTPWIDRLWQLASHVLLLATPDRQTMLDAYAAIKLSRHERTASKLQLVVTHCDAGADAARVHAGLSATCERFLGSAIRPPAVLPTLAPEDDAAFQRSVRLLAADLVCECRALTSRIPSRRWPQYDQGAAALVGRLPLADSRKPSAESPS